MRTIQKKSARRTVEEIDFTATEIRSAWRRKPDSGGEVCYREKDGSLALRTSRRSLAILALRYSKLHGQTVQRSLRRFEKPEDITDAAVDQVRALAEAFAKECERDDSQTADQERQRKLKKYRRYRLRQLADLYFESEHFLKEIKNENARRNRRGMIENFLAYSPKREGKAFPFGARRIVEKKLSEKELEQYRRDTVSKHGGKPFVHNVTRAHVVKMLRVLADDGYISRDSIFAMKKEKEKPSVICRNVTLSTPMICALWNATTALPAYQKNFVRLLMLTGQRRSVISDLKDNECVFEHDTPQLRISGERSKNGLDYMIPATPLMIELIREVPRIENNPHVFAVSDNTAMSGFNALKRKLDKSMQDELGAKFYTWRFHDLRRVFVERCNLAGVEPRVRELLMAHTPNWVSSTERNYNVTDYVPEKIAAMHAVEEQLMRIIHPERYAQEGDEKSAVLQKLSGLPIEKLKMIEGLIAI